MTLTRSIARLAIAILSLAAATTEARAQNSCQTATNSCFEVNLVGKGCNNPECCGIVCTIEPGCCDVAWDELCVALAQKFCSTCGTGADSCFSPHPAPSCNDGLVCEAVCGTTGFEACCAIAWDQACVDLALQLTANCGAPAAGSCLTAHVRPYCADSECCNSVCAIDPNCCTNSWDQRCVDWANRVCFTCGSPCAGSCCHAHENPYCSDQTCCEEICVSDAFCCDTRWDEFCARLATETCAPCERICGYVDPNDPVGRACQTAHPFPGCSDARCCDRVCEFDSFCCAVTWDYSCVQIARSRCSLTANAAVNAVCHEANGSCFSPHADPGCEDAACCGTVCAIDILCCEIGGAGWDQACATLATTNCNDSCGDLNAGSCTYPHGTPGCLDRDCCTDVCRQDATCCSTEWDSFCVNLAIANCSNLIEGGDPRTRPCAIPSFIPACEDARCCESVCLFDPTCCTRAWDETCAAATRFACDDLIPNNCPGPGSPLVVHAFPGCSDIECCTAVCSVDPLCCSLGWSQRCVDRAKELCWSFGGCPGEEACDRSHQSPGCSDATCCSVVCFTDPLCCEVQWNSPCVTLARNLCSNPPDDCPCAGSCFEAHDNPGCENEVCCTAVCETEGYEYCCTIGWDSSCASMARVMCCTSSNCGCGDSCAGDCLTPHLSPHCNDPACCEAVCRFDSYCCDVRWDSSCVLRARETCITAYIGLPQKPHESVGGCGQLVSGSCYASHDWPGCADGRCCVQVCNADPLCCDEAWDVDCATAARTLCAASLPNCGDRGLDGCNIPHASPSCSDAPCCNAVCAADPFCCTEQWDQACVVAIFTTPECTRYRYGCGDTCAGDCCEAHGTPWCNDFNCCKDVCANDPFCCEEQWDTVCAASARQNPECERVCPDPKCGTPEAGGCCFAHDNANCNDQACCDEVCLIDPFCCTTVWDLQCAGIATTNCEICESDLACGSPDAGSCCNEHPAPYCSDQKCCDVVCNFDFGCCTVEWDTNCVKIAQAFCNCQ